MVDSKEILQCYKIVIKNSLCTSKTKEEYIVKNWIKTPLLSCAIYINAKAYQKILHQTCKTKTPKKTGNGL